MTRSGRVAVDSSGKVRLDDVPAPVLGTFWPFALGQAKLKSVAVRRERVQLERTALWLPENLEANIGAEVVITERPTDEHPGKSYPATILGIPTRTGEELDAARPDTPGPLLPERSQQVLLKTEQGFKLVPLEAIADVAFREAPRERVAYQEIRNVMRLSLESKTAARLENPEVGFSYVQKGIRWIPSYRVELGSDGKARVELQATLVNELTDLEDVTAYLVIGVPLIKFEGTMDPIALGKQVARLSDYFQRQPGASGRLTSQMMSNVTMAQVSNYEPAQPSEPTPPLDVNVPELQTAARSEDLFLFTVPHLTLKKGEVMTLPISEATLGFADVYTLDVMPVPSPDLLRLLGNPEPSAISRMMDRPKVTHKIRLANSTSTPLTTAPAMLLMPGRGVAQTMMTYTPAGGSVDIEVGTALDVTVALEDLETRRTPDAVTVYPDRFPLTLIEMAGELSLRNRHSKLLVIEVTRYLLGKATSANPEAKISALDVLEDQGPVSWPNWWRAYSWPWWWERYNGRSRVVWKVTLEPGAQSKLAYTWQYYGQ